MKPIQFPNVTPETRDAVFAAVRATLGVREKRTTLRNVVMRTGIPRYAARQCLRQLVADGLIVEKRAMRTHIFYSLPQGSAA